MAGNDLARSIDLSPSVPEQHAPHAAFAQIINHALAINGFPIGHSFQPRVEFADGFVAEVKEVGIEKWKMIVVLALAGHVATSDFAHGIGVILVLDAEAFV